MKHLKRGLCGLLAMLMLISHMPAENVFAAVTVRKEAVRDLWSKVLQAHANDKKVSDDNRVPAYPAGCETVWDKDDKNLEVRNTSIAFIASTVVLNIEEYPGLAVEAVNDFLDFAVSSSVFKFTPFSSNDYVARIDTNVSQDTQPCYLLDTLGTASKHYDWMYNRYAGGIKYPGLICVNATGDAKTMIGCLMDSGDMNGAKGLVYDAAAYAGENSSAHITLLNNAIDRGYNPRVCSYNAETGNWDITYTVDEIKDKIGQASGKTNYIPLTGLTPLVVPTFKTNGVDDPTYKTTLVHEGILYTNECYLAAKYWGGSSYIRYGGTKASVLDGKSSALTDNMNYKWYLDGSGKSAEVFSEMTSLCIGSSTGAYFNALTRAIMSQIVNGAIYFHLNDFLILQAASSAYGFYVSDANAVEYEVGEHPRSTSYANGYEELYSCLYAKNAYGRLIAYPENFYLNIQNMYEVFFSSYFISASGVSPEHRVLGIPITTAFNYSNIFTGKTFAAGCSMGSGELWMKTSAGESLGYSAQVSLNIPRTTMFSLKDKVYIPSIPAPNTYGPNRLFKCASGEYGIASSSGNKFYNAAYKISASDIEVTYKMDSSSAAIWDTAAVGNESAVAGKYLIVTASSIPSRVITVKAEKDAEGNNVVDIIGPVRLLESVTLTAAGPDETSKNKCYELFDSIDETWENSIQNLAGPVKDSSKRTLTFTRNIDSSNSEIAKIQLVIPATQVVDGDIQFTVSAKGLSIYPTAGGNAIEAIIVNARADKEYEEDAKPRVEDVGSDKTTVTIGGNPSPVVVSIIQYTTEKNVKSDEVFELYEGCSYKFYPQFDKNPVSITESGTLTVKCTPPAGDRIELSIPYSGSNLPGLNEALKEQFLGYVEYYNVNFGGEDYVSKPPIKIEFTFSTSDTKITSSTNVNVYKWKSAVEAGLGKPSSNVVQSNNPTEVTINMSNELDRNGSDAKGEVCAIGTFKTEHNLTFKQEPEGDNGGRLYPEQINSAGNQITLNNSDAKFFSEGITEYTKAAIKGDYMGTLTMESGKWTIKDTATVYIKSARTGEYVAVVVDEADVTLQVTDMAPVLARFEASSANLNEAVGFEFQTFKAEDFGLSSITNPKVTWNKDGGSIGDVNVSVSGSGGSTQVSISGSISFSKKGKYNVGGFQFTCDEMSPVTSGDDASFAFSEIKVPPEQDYKPFVISVTPDNEKVEASGGSAVCAYTITLVATPDYENWKANTNASNSIRITFDLRPSGASVTSTDIQSNIGGNPGSSNSWSGTVGSISPGDSVSINYVVKLPEGARQGEHELDVTALIQYTSDSGRTVSKESNDKGSYTIEEGEPIEGLTFVLDVSAETPYATVVSNMPDPKIWKWDVMNAIPCTETVSVAVGASLYDARVETAVIALGNAVAGGGGRSHKENESDDPLDSPALTRTIKFHIKVKDLWAAETSERCELSCSGHGNSHSCPSTSSISHDGTITPCSYCGWQLSYSITCDEDAKCDCCAGTCDGAQSCTCEEATDENPNPPKCSSCSHTCACTCPTCPAGTVGCSGSDSGSEACPTGAETFHTITWNCSTNETTAEAGGAASASASGGHLNDYQQTYTGISWSWSCGHCGGSGEGPYEFAGPIDHGYTVEGTYGCSCNNNRNNAEHRKDKYWYDFTVIQQVDFITYHKILTCQMGALAYGTITEASELYEDGTKGRNILIGDSSAHIWCGPDDDVLSNPYDTSYNAANKIYGKGRIRYTSCGEAGYNAFGGSSWLSAIDGYDPTVFADSEGMSIAIEAVANRDVVEKIGEFKNQFVSDSIGDYTLLWGIENNKYVSEFGVDGGFKEAHLGAYLTEAECKDFATHIINDWLANGNSVGGSGYGCYAISDSASYADACLIAGSYISERIPLWNISFTAPNQTMYRTHCTGTNADNQTLARQYSNSLFSDFKGGDTGWIGYTGNYNPNSPDTMYKLASMSGRIGDSVELLLTEYKTPERCTYGPGGGYMMGTAGGFNYDPYDDATDVGTLSVSGGGGTDISLRDDEFYSPSVSEVGVSATVTGTSKAGTSDAVTGEYLIPFASDGLTLADRECFSFLGVQLNPTTKNGVYEDSLEVAATYMQMIAYNADSFGAFSVTQQADMTSTSTKVCQFTEGDTSSINPVVIVNPIGVDTFMYDNTYGANTNVYAIDESQEDFRTESAGRGNPHIVVGNTFNVWISKFIDSASESTAFNSMPVTTSWSRDNNCCEASTGEPNEDSGGTGSSLYTDKWARKCEITFGFPVSYENSYGAQIDVAAGETILLWERTFDANGNVATETEYIPSTESAPPTGDVDYMGSMYTFTCSLSSPEYESASYSAVLYGINPKASSAISMGDNTGASRTRIVADDIVMSSGSVAIVGRIGDLAVTDTQDYRFTNAFWEEDEDWLIEDIVKDSTLTSKQSLQAKYNILKSAIPVYGSVNKSNSGTVTTGLSGSSRYSLPLSSAIQELPEFFGDNLGLGYNTYISLSTIGNYTGELGDAYYPESILEEGVVPDTRSNEIKVWPKYVLYDMDEDKFYDIKLFAGTSTNYDLYWSNEDWEPNYANEISLSMDEEVERLRYCVSDFAKYYSLLYNTNTFSAFTDYVYQGTANKIILDERSNIVIGVKGDASRPMSYNLESSEFRWEREDGTSFKTTAGTPTMGKQSAADYAVNTRRWFFSLGLPSSTVVTYTDPGTNALAIRNNHEKLLREHPNSVIVCFADIYAQGEVWDLQYDYARCNGSTTVNICGKSVDFDGTPVYINDRVSYTLNSSWAPLFVSDVERTSTQDLTQEGTH